MKQINVSDARTHLSRLVREVQDGREDEFIILRNGRPAVKLIPLAKTAHERS